MHRTGTALVASIAAATAQGATVVYTSQASFLAAAGGVGPADTFNGLDETVSRGPVTGSYSNFAYSAALSPSVPAGDGLGVLSDPGSTDMFVVANRLSSAQNFVLRLDFSGGDSVTAVGGNLFRYDQSNKGSVGGNMEVRLYTSLGALFHVENFVSAGRSTFLGFASDVTIGSMEIRATGPGMEVNRYSALDNLYYGAAIVPLPPAAWAGLGLLGVIGGVRAVRRRG